jgi:hypothetical protein
MLVNSCEYVHDIMHECLVIAAVSKDEHEPFCKQFVAPLAKAVVWGMIVDEEKVDDYFSDECDF